MPTERYMVGSGVLTDKERKNVTILDIIRRQGPLAKTEISKISGFNIVTVSNYVDGYIANGLVVERGYDVSSGGRKPLLVELNAEASYVVGVGLTIFHEIAAVCNLRGEVIHEIKRERSLKIDASLVESMLEITNDALSGCGIAREKMKKIAIALPAIIDPRAQTTRWQSALGTQDIFINISLPDIFEDKLGMPTIVENDADAALFGERWFGLRQDITDLLYMYSGVACGIIINGQIYHGATGAAGELGIFNPDEGTPKKWEE